MITLHQITDITPMARQHPKGGYHDIIKLTTDQLRNEVYGDHIQLPEGYPARRANARLGGRIERPSPTNGYNNRIGGNAEQAIAHSITDKGSHIRPVVIFGALFIIAILCSIFLGG